MITSNLFDEIIELPDPEVARQFDELVGLDHIKELLVKQGRLLLNPQLLSEWSEKYHGTKLPGVKTFAERAPLLVFSGDVGTGKTTLANSFGDPIARSEKITTTVLRLSLITRGRGAVGEMTNLISQAFEEVETLARRGLISNNKPTSALVLVIDEADALAESRATEQMHHEDRAGVNALIRGIDRLTQKHLPALVVLCTNRYEAIDPAVLRRAAEHYKFERPNVEQRESLLRRAFNSVLADKDYRQLAEQIGPDNNGRNYGYTFSDITHRFIPSLILEAFPNRPITIDLAIAVARKVEPTKPFSSQIGEHD